MLIDQAAAADDRWQVWFGLHRLGMPVAQIDRARRLAVMRPLRVLLVIAVGATVIVLSPMIGAGALISPMTLAAVVVVLGAGAAMIPIALQALLRHCAVVPKEGLRECESSPGRRQPVAGA